MKEIKRDYSIDIIRGTAVILMTITHINAVFYSGKSIFMDILTMAGATVCFSTFIFCSGYVFSIKIYRKRKIFKRILELYLAYLIIGLIVFISKNKGIEIKEILNILTFNTPPEFADFLISFIFFSIFSHLFKKQIIELLKTPKLLFFVSILIYILGLLAYTILSEYEYPAILRIFLENIFGYKDHHRFPLTFYLPIYTLGIILRRNKLDINILFLLSLSINILLYLLNIFSWYRWPPTPMILSESLIYIFGMYSIFKGNEGKDFLTKSLARIGRNSLHLLVISSLIIFIFSFLISSSTSSFLSIHMYIFILLTFLIYPIVTTKKMV